MRVRFRGRDGGIVNIGINDIDFEFFKLIYHDLEVVRG